MSMLTPWITGVAPYALRTSRILTEAMGTFLRNLIAPLRLDREAHGGP
jgi:hypothetical protein